MGYRVDCFGKRVCFVQEWITQPVPAGPAGDLFERRLVEGNVGLGAGAQALMFHF